MAQFLRDVPVGGHYFTVLTCSTAAQQMSDIDCQMVMFQGGESNSGEVAFGDSSVAATTYPSLSAGEYSPWIPCSNLNELYYIAATDADTMRVMAIT